MTEVKKKIHIPIYGGWMHVAMSDEDNIYELAKRNFNVDDESLKDYDGVVLVKGDFPTGVYPVLFSGKISPGIVAHEAKHIVNRIFTDIDMLLDRSNDECETYLLSWIVNRIWEVKMKLEKKKNEELNRTDK